MRQRSQLIASDSGGTRYPLTSLLLQPAYTCWIGSRVGCLLSISAPRSSAPNHLLRESEHMETWWRPTACCAYANAWKFGHVARPVAAMTCTSGQMVAWLFVARVRRPKMLVRDAQLLVARTQAWRQGLRGPRCRPHNGLKRGSGKIMALERGARPEARAVPARRRSVTHVQPICSH